MKAGKPLKSFKIHNDLHQAQNQPKEGHHQGDHCQAHGKSANLLRATRPLASHPNPLKSQIARQVVMKLSVSSNIKTLPSGGVVGISARPRGNNNEIRVAYTGQGIDQVDRERIFQRFYRADRSQPGTVLGLTIIRQIVQSHGGTIRVGDNSPRGSVFIVELPYSTDLRQSWPGINHRRRCLLVSLLFKILLCHCTNFREGGFVSLCFIYQFLSLDSASSKPGLNMVKNELTISSISGVNPCSTHQTMHDHNAPE